ncbi:MAG: sulfatase-like hydrolase/transferase [Gemmataceae bacterium]|nr:sulfatase-like hydrolase/transferase [Gemmataceae bacterium]
MFAAVAYCCLVGWAWSEQMPDPAVRQVRRPNFLIILCDDLGYGDLGCFGHPQIRTPNLDRLAQRGLRLTDCYAAAPVCSPSRAGLLTGRIPTRTGVHTWISENNPMHLPATEITLATLLRRLGYRTAHVGKWHLNGYFNSPKQPQPHDHGFEHWFSTQNNAAPSHADPNNFVRNGKPVGPLKGFSCQIVVDEAIAWLQQIRAGPEPFFLFVCFHEPHEPVASPADLVASYPKAKSEDEAQYFASVANLDAAVGRLLKALEQLGQAEDTIIFFSSDNGPETLNRYKTARRSFGSAGPLRGRKLSLYEGGIRVPGILYWPAKHVPPTLPRDARPWGKVSNEPVWSLDLFPTFARAAGATLPDDRPIDGADLTSMLAGQAVVRKTPLFWHYYRALGPMHTALREGDWVVLGKCEPVPKGSGGTWQLGDGELLKKGKLVAYELYHLRDDLAQTKDLANDELERLRLMGRRLNLLFREVCAEGPDWRP